MADVGEEEVEAPAPEPEKTPEEKIQLLKEQLENGEMGPAQFDVKYQSVWMEIKANEGMMVRDERRGQRGSIVSNRGGAAEDE